MSRPLGRQHSSDDDHCSRTSMNSAQLSPLCRRSFLLAAAALAAPARAQALDHRHTAWTALLKKYVVLLDGGKASQLRYAGMAADGVARKAYLADRKSVV